jgi:hypothetical protein
MVLGIQLKKSDQSVEYFPRHMIVQGQYIEQKYTKMIELRIMEARILKETKEQTALVAQKTQRCLSLACEVKKIKPEL